MTNTTFILPTFIITLHAVSLTCLTLLLLHMIKPSFNYFGDDCFTQLIKPPTFIMSTWRGDNACAAFILIPFPFTSTSNVFVVSILDRIFSRQVHLRIPIHRNLTHLQML